MSASKYPPFPLRYLVVSENDPLNYAELEPQSDAVTHLLLRRFVQEHLLIWRLAAAPMRN
jgi:hypothetical protein